MNNESFKSNMPNVFFYSVAGTNALFRNCLEGRKPRVISHSFALSDIMSSTVLIRLNLFLTLSSVSFLHSSVSYSFLYSVIASSPCSIKRKSICISFLERALAEVVISLTPIRIRSIDLLVTLAPMAILVVLSQVFLNLEARGSQVSFYGELSHAYHIRPWS